MMGLEKELYDGYLDEHRSKVTTYLFWINAIFLLIGCIWNFVFLLFDLELSRANSSALLVCLGLLLLLGLINRFANFSSEICQFIMLAYCAGVLIVLYFESGYYESWSFLLLLPLLTGIYGEGKILFYYSFLGLGIMLYLSINEPKIHSISSNIDISNRILVYIIIASLSYLVLKTLHDIYKRQVTFVVQSMETTIQDIVNTFIVAVEAKDLYTFGHSERVSKYAVALAKHLPEYRKNDLKNLRLSGLLHDLGKINIPEGVLTKTGKLTEEEYEVIKTHPAVGARMIERIERLQALSDGVLYHHERWDGKGYPTNRKGTDIPLDARILAIADAFDAMTTDRSYRRGFTLDEAFKRLEEGKGSQFDPHLIEVLRIVKYEFKKIHQEFNDRINEIGTLP